MQQSIIKRAIFAPSVDKQNLLSHPKSLQDKLFEAKILNEKLVKLYQSLKNNIHLKNLQHSHKDSLMSNKNQLQTKKQLNTLQTQIQHLKNIQNILLSQNKKLKEDVNNKRKQRVIYSNIFKKYEKDIKTWQDQYKETLLNSLTSLDAQKKIKQKLQKMKKKMEKQIKMLQDYKALKQQQVRKANQKSPLGILEMITKKMSEGMNNKNNQNTQAQNELRLQQIQYQKQSKIIILNNLAKQLIQISQTNQLSKAIELFQSIDSKTDNIYDKYQQLQIQNKKLNLQIQKIQQELNQKNKLQNNKIDSIKNIQELEQLNQQIKKQKLKLTKIQDQISQKLDINCRKLPTQQLRSFIQRIRLSKIQSKKGTQKTILGHKKNTSSTNIVQTTKQYIINTKMKKDDTNEQINQKNTIKKKNLLQRKLQQVQKQKSVDGYLLTYTQINKSMLKHYASIKDKNKQNI